MIENTLPVTNSEKVIDPNDRRNKGRLPCELTLTCRLVRKRFACARVTVIDISTTGIGLILDRRIDPGNILAIELQGERGSTRTLLCRIAHITERDTGDFVVGCEFASLLTHQDVEELLN